MMRLFIALVSFLAVSATGLWYSMTSDIPLDKTSFENASLTLEAAAPKDMETEKAEASQEASVTVAAEPKPQPVETTPADTVAIPPIVSPATEPSGTGGLSITARILRFGFRTPAAPRTIDTIVLHSSYNALGGDQYSVDKTIGEYEQYGVGAHYLIDRSGNILRLVEEGNIAYHAGTSKMPDGRKNVNDFSIGIELIATEDSSSVMPISLPAARPTPGNLTGRS
jgi:hypothetical protein